MHNAALLALAYSCIATVLHVATILLTIWRLKKPVSGETRIVDEPVTIIRPVCGLEHFDELTLGSTFNLDEEKNEVIFCCAHGSDPAVALVKHLIAENPKAVARLLIGDERPTANPKLNNIVKGWQAARHDFIIIADSNVLMPRSYVSDMFAAADEQTGLVCSPPIGSMPIGFWAELECAFLNGYQARWQCAADSVGFGFAQGKSMLWQRDLIDRAGGIVALGSEIAEDAAATKIVRAHGLKVRLVARPFDQALGPRSARQIWNRQVRWARLRRATFPIYYVPEALTGAALPLAAGAFAADCFDASARIAFFILAAVWYGSEAMLTRAAGWHLSRQSPIAWVLRDIMLPILWIKGWTGNSFNWRGNDMTVGEAPARPALQTAGGL
jgi:ceramide glucosyltransferase